VLNSPEKCPSALPGREAQIELRKWAGLNSLDSPLRVLGPRSCPQGSTSPGSFPPFSARSHPAADLRLLRHWPLPPPPMPAVASSGDAGRCLLRRCWPPLPQRRPLSRSGPPPLLWPRLASTPRPCLASTPRPCLASTPWPCQRRHATADGPCAW
jgi:hypothetical protein